MYKQLKKQLSDKRVLEDLIRAMKIVLNLKYRSN